jgi:uncharacterized Ntn-hydrolase superfamily protein
MLELNTFSMAARCPRSGMLGVAVSTAVPGVGAICPWVEAEVGAIATQSWVNPYLGIDGLAYLRGGMSAATTLNMLLAEDPGRDVRQIGIVDSHGNAAAHTGSECVTWAGHILGDGFCVQGNMLVGADTISAMASSARESGALDLPERLMLALEAAQTAGGDKRGKQSAGIRIFAKEAYPWLDLRVDEHRHPVAELRRVLEVARRQLMPFIAGMPTRANPLGDLQPETTRMLLRPPALR